MPEHQQQPHDHLHHSRSRGWLRVASFGLVATLATGGLSIAGAIHSAPAEAATGTNGLNLTGGDSSLLSADSVSLAPGLDLTNFRRLQPAGWVTGHVMSADLSTPTLSLDLLDSGTVSGGATVAQQIAGTGAVAAVNGDYFDINFSGGAIGTDVSPKKGLRNASSSPTQAFTITDGVAAIQALTAKGSFVVGGVSTKINGINTPGLSANGIGWYTSVWGAHPLSRPLGGPDSLATQIEVVTVKDGHVVSLSNDPAAVAGATAIADGSGVLIGREAGAATLAALTVGQAIDVTVGASADVDLAVSGSQRMIVNGVQTPEDQVEAGRTAVGVNRDGTHVSIVSIDGRQGDGRGMTIQELGDLMLDLGAYNAVNLDGGGSTTLLARLPGTTSTQVIDRPSDGSERVVANSLAFYSSAPAGQVKDVAVAPTLTSDGADAVFPGLHRTLSGVGLDANLAGIPTSGTFAATGSAATVTAVDGATARVEGVSQGSTKVAYTADGKTATTGIRVLGALERIKPSSTVVALPDPGQTATVTLSGLDADGFAAPIETGDVTVKSGSAVSVTPTGLGQFTITPTSASGSATVTFTAAGKSADVAVTIGNRNVSVADFADGAKWTIAADRATGTTVADVGPNGEPALRLNYDFSQSTATRGYYAVLPEMSKAGSAGREVAGQPQALTLWIKGDGEGTWPRIQIKNAAGTVVNLDGPFVDWTGWKQARFAVPAGTAYPISIQRIRMLETKSTVSYQGSATISDLEAVVAADVAQPVVPTVYDPVVVTNGTVDGRAQHIAVMSDAQFVSRDPNSAIVVAARQTMRQIVAAKPDFLVIDGDLVDEASAADMAFAKSILDDEIGTKIPYIYVPGNHEVMGGAISNFQAEFGATTHAVSVGHTKILTLNSSAGSFRASDPDQLAVFDTELAAAKADQNITGVLVFNHHPADDPLPDKASQLGDRFEAAQFTKTLEQFRASSGKSIAVVNGHVGVFNAASSGGVSQLINGNSGKNPAGTVSTGGFTGWTMLGINPGAGSVGTAPATVADRIGWMRAEIKPRVEELSLDAPSVLQVGETVKVAATVKQDDRVAPVQWPMSAVWSGDNLQTDDGSRAEQVVSGVLRLNSMTGELTAVGAGKGSVTVTVNGTSRTTAVSVVAAAGDPADPGAGNGAGGNGAGNNGAGNNGAGNPATTHPSASGDLAFTGVNAITPVLIGLLVLAAGLGLLVVARRRGEMKRKD